MKFSSFRQNYMCIISYVSTLIGSLTNGLYLLALYFAIKLVTLFLKVNFSNHEAAYW